MPGIAFEQGLATATIGVVDRYAKHIQVVPAAPVIQRIIGTAKQRVEQHRIHISEITDRKHINPREVGNEPAADSWDRQQISRRHDCDRAFREASLISAMTLSLPLP